MAEMTVRIEGVVPVSNSSTTGVLKVQNYFGASSLHAAGMVPNAVAGQAIVTLAAPPAGFYRIDVHRAADGSGTPQLYNNGDFRVGATSNVLLSVPELGTLYNYTFYEVLDGTQALSVNAVTNVTTNITITASITATRIS